MLNPYENVDWTLYHQIMTTTHDHVYDPNVSTTTKQHFNNLYDGGVRCFAISNYYPSEPMYPLSEWKDELDRDIPEDIIEIPNAEHHYFTMYGETSYNNVFHLNSVGSLFSSGKPRGETPIGYHGDVKKFVKDALGGLLYPDGGGITINHFTWTKNQRGEYPLKWFMDVLDLDERVLGIEMSSSFTYDIEAWDTILLTGRRCWGFAVPDHKHKSNNPEWRGRSMLIVPELTDHECLKAIRNGTFYTKMYNTTLGFDHISVKNGSMVVETTTPATIRFVVDGNVVYENENSTSEAYPLNTVMTYIRAEAETEDDRIFTQPIMMRLRQTGVMTKEIATKMGI